MPFGRFWAWLLPARYVKEAAQRFEQAVFDANNDGNDDNDVCHHVHCIEHGTGFTDSAADGVTTTKHLCHDGDFQPRADGDNQVIQESLATVYYKNGESFDSLHIEGDLLPAFERYKDWAIEYYDEV